MAVMHLPTKFCANSSIQFAVIDIFRNPRWRPPPSWIFKSYKFGTFRHVNNVVLELYIKFGSNICDSHWDQHTCSRRSFDDVSRINFRFRLLIRWSSSHGSGASSNIVWCKIALSSPKLLTFFRNFKMAAAAILDFQFMWIWPFRRVDSVVFVFCTKFGSNICYSHYRRTFASDVHLMTSRELTSGFDFWSRGHLCVAVMHLTMKFGADIFIQSGVIDIFRKLKMSAAAILDLFRWAMGPTTKPHSWPVPPVKILSWSAR